MEMEQTLELANNLLANWDWDVQSSRPAGNRLDITLTDPQNLVPMVAAMRIKRLAYLISITGTDLGAENGNIEIIYCFGTGPALITLRVFVPRDDALIASLTDIIPSADVFERELHEMLGVTITGLRDTSRLYLPDDWPDGVFPLRKDFDPQVLHPENRQGKQE